MPIFRPTLRVLVPDPSIVVLGLVTDAVGNLVLTVPWPSTMAPGAILYFQYWVVDPNGPQGLAASNGLAAIPPP